MLKLALWQSSTAVTIVLGMASSTAMPVLMSSPAHATSLSNVRAQLIAQQSEQNRIPSGTVIPVRYEQEKIVLTPDETVPVTLIVARNLQSSSGTTLVRAGSKLQGKVRPADGGSQFVADTLILRNGTKIPIDASSNVVNNQQEIRKETDTGSILKGAAIGGGAAALIRGVTGNGFRVGTVLIGGAAGALGGWLLGKKSTRVNVVRPADLTVTLSSPLSL